MITEQLLYDALKEYSDFKNKEIKDTAKEYSKWLIDNCGGEHGKDEKGYWWIYKGNSKPLNEDEIYKKFLQSKNK